MAARYKILHDTLVQRRYRRMKRELDRDEYLKAQKVRYLIDDIWRGDLQAQDELTPLILKLWPSMKKRAPKKAKSGHY